MLGAFLAIGYLALALLVVRSGKFFDLTGIGRRATAIVLVLKCAASCAIWWTYTHHYPDRQAADIFKFFDDSAVMYSALPGAPGDFVRMVTGVANDTDHFTETYYRQMNNWFREYEGNLYNDSHTMIRFNALVRLFSFGHFPVHMVVAAFLGLIGLTAILRAFLPHFPGQERTLFVLVHGTPSVLYWGSGVIKESLVFFGIGLLLWQGMRWMRGELRWTGLPVILMTATFLFFLKFYVLLSMLPGFIAMAWCFRKPGHTLLKFTTVLAVFFLIGTNIQRLLPGFDLLDIIYWKHQDFIGLATEASSGSYVPPPPLRPDPGSFIRFAPYALYITLLGPLVHPADGLLGWAAAAENVMILVVLVALLIGHRRILGPNDPAILFFLISFITILGLVIGYTTPVMGAIVRYRTPAIPFLLIAALILHDPARWRIRHVPFLFPRPQ